MGLPWDDLLDALLRFQVADRERSPAAVDAAAEVERQRERLALVGALLFDAATRPLPGSRPTLLTGSVVRFLELSGVAGILAELQERIDDPRRCAEWMAFEVKRLKAENWELARWVAELQRRIETLEHERTEQSREPAGQSRGSGSQGQREAVA